MKALMYALAALTLLLIVGVIACALLAIWGPDSTEEQWTATAFLCAFVGILTGGGAGFAQIEVDKP